MVIVQQTMESQGQGSCSHAYANSFDDVINMQKRNSNNAAHSRKSSIHVLLPMVQACGEGLIENSKESSSPQKQEYIIHDNTITSEAYSDEEIEQRLDFIPSSQMPSR